MTLKHRQASDAYLNEQLSRQNGHAGGSANYQDKRSSRVYLPVLACAMLLYKLLLHKD